MSEKLKSCPICGNDTAMLVKCENSDNDFIIACDWCKLRTAYFCMAEDAIKAWNERYNEDQQEEEIYNKINNIYNQKKIEPLTAYFKNDIQMSIHILADKINEIIDEVNK